ncbi:syntaxin-112 [Amborella trichopoda]|uniref:syntaxin-112 n=1 Tax=Amborella trichopoda TaxID=13333 RepID=UPI0005D41B0B|nr:syntaxin-112 [Amborella trichopoda]|eukprot:XP_011629085.1 syntaxin-112 [Amborella trichopoda]
MPEHYGSDLHCRSAYSKCWSACLYCQTAVLNCQSAVNLRAKGSTDQSDDERPNDQILHKLWNSKNQALKDLEAGPDLELSDPTLEDEKNQGQLFEEVGVIKGDIEILYDLRNLKDADREMKSLQDPNPLKFLRERMDLDVVSVLKKARAIKARLEFLDKSNADNRRLYSHKEGSFVDKTRVSVSNGLRKKLREVMKDFQSLKEKIVVENRDGLRRKVYAETGLQVRQLAEEEVSFSIIT